MLGVVSLRKESTSSSSGTKSSILVTPLDGLEDILIVGELVGGAIAVLVWDETGDGATVVCEFVSAGRSEVAVSSDLPLAEGDETEAPGKRS